MLGHGPSCNIEIPPQETTASSAGGYFSSCQKRGKKNVDPVGKGACAQAADGAGQNRTSHDIKYRIEQQVKACFHHGVEQIDKPYFTAE